MRCDQSIFIVANVHHHPHIDQMDLWRVAPHNQVVFCICCILIKVLFAEQVWQTNTITNVTVITHAKCTLIDFKAITEKGHIVGVLLALIKCAGFKSQWPATIGHNDLSADEQPNLKKDPNLRESKYILVSDNTATIGSCMINDHPTITLHPTLGTGFNLSASGDRHQVISTTNITHNWCTHLQHSYLPSPASAALLYQACITSVTLPVPNWQFPHGVSPWVLSP